MNFLTVDQLRDYATANPIDYLVEGILKEGTFNLASGEAKSGKSTLVRHLASCVTKGEPFLGKPTKQGRVLFACPDETDSTELARAFDTLGVKDGLLISPNPVDKSRFSADLGEWLVKLPDTKLVVLDTLAKTVEFEDLNSYEKVVRDFSPIQDLARETGVTILALHHTNKGNGNSIAASIMGSGGIASLAATILEVSNSNGRRYLRSLQRYGTEIERAELYLDKETGVLSLGRTASEVREAGRVTRADELETKIIRYIASTKNATRKDVRVAVKTNTQKVNRVLDSLTERKLVVCTGTGKNSDPHTFSPGEPPTEEQVAA
jgi:hypothetical protein